MNIKSLIPSLSALPALLCCEQVLAQVSQFGLDARPSNASCIAPPQPSGNAVVAVEDPFPTAPDFVAPVKMLQAPGDATRWFVLEQGGRVKVFNVANPAAVSVYLDFTAKTNNNGEGGLMGMAFHPGFPATPEVFLFYTGNPGGPMVSTLSRVILDNVSAPVNPIEQVILTVDQPNTVHHGGDIAFGADGYLYLGTGDADVRLSSQDNTDLLGSMLRIEVLNTPWPNPGYRIPESNPFSANPRCGPASNAQNCPEIYAWGLRNPWRWSFDRPTGDLWLGDVGENAWEEVNLIELGGNHGWPCREGAHDLQPSLCQPAAFVDPVSEYERDTGAAITGGYVYRGSSIPALQGRYVFADFIRGTFFALRGNGQGGYTNEQLLDTSMLPVAFGMDQSGELYFADYSTNRLYRLRPAGVTVPDTIPDDLAATGCANPAIPSQPSAGLIPYSVNAPFWSDTAAKTRYLGLPDGATIDIGASGDWDLPPGSVIRKDFTLGTQLVETRLLMRHPDGIWAGYTYEWNDAQTAATRVRGGKTRVVAGQSWMYPNEDQCMQCHTSAAGFSLGLENAQLNGNYTYPSTGRTANQLSTLAHIGMFSAPLPPGSPASLPHLVDPMDTSQIIHERERAWLHTNCSQCHRPGGPTPAAMDLRYSTPLQSMNVCGITPSLGDLGIANARLVAPGDAAHSVLSARASRRDAYGMPPLASSSVDLRSVLLIRGWINNLGSCQDTDNDQADDARDNCVNVVNTSQRDSNADGYGNACDADLDNNGFVAFSDIALFRQRFDTSDPDADLNGDGTVNFADLVLFRQLYAKPPGPSGLHP